MSEVTTAAPAHLVDRTPRITGAEIVATLVPPPQFANATFETFRPDPAHPSQEEARSTLQAFTAPKVAPSKGNGFFGFGKKKKPAQSVDRAHAPTQPGVYLDGGFGVGKTHLLAAAWHAQAGTKYFGTFIEYTALVGALGYDGALQALNGAKLICIDEFELDDPGDTMLMTRMIKDLTNNGAKIVATSNTPPNALGEGRFAAVDFLREIQSMSDRFLTIRIDGEDYRQRNIEGDSVTLTDEQYQFALADTAMSGGRATDDDFGELLKHLSSVHPSSYASLIRGVNAIGLRNVYELTDQSAALRFVAFIDRVYDAQTQVLSTGVPLSQVFGGGMTDGGYRKKYLRCISRVNALTAEGQ